MTLDDCCCDGVECDCWEDAEDEVDGLACEAGGVCVDDACRANGECMWSGNDDVTVLEPTTDGGDDV